MSLSFGLERVMVCNLGKAIHSKTTRLWDNAHKGDALRV